MTHSTVTVQFEFDTPATAEEMRDTFAEVADALDEVVE